MMQPGLLICFTGIDGSGKTTQAKLLIDWLASQHIKSIYIWSRGEVLSIRRILLFLGRSALRTSTHEINNDRNSYRTYQSRKSKLLRNPLISTIWSITTTLEHMIQINWDIRGKLKAGFFIVCDRYFWDSTIDMAILNRKAPQWLSGRINTFLWKLVPHPAITFWVDVPPEEAIKRKNDIPSYDYLLKRAEFYRYLAKIDAITVIDGCSDLDAIHHEISHKVTNYLEGLEII
jgi:thymidylate kinase